MSGHSVLKRVAFAALGVQAALAAFLLSTTSLEARTGETATGAFGDAPPRREFLIRLYESCSNYPCLSVKVFPPEMGFISPRPSRCIVYLHQAENAKRVKMQESGPCDLTRDHVIARSDDERSVAITWTKTRRDKAAELFVLPVFADPPQVAAAVSFNTYGNTRDRVPTITGMAWLEPRVLQVNLESLNQILYIGDHYAFVASRRAKAAGKRSGRPKVFEVPDSVSGRYKLTFDTAGGFAGAEYMDMPPANAECADGTAEAEPDAGN